MDALTVLRMVASSCALFVLVYVGVNLIKEIKRIGKEAEGNNEVEIDELEVKKLKRKVALLSVLAFVILIDDIIFCISPLF